VRFSEFVDVFVAALYNETQLTRRTSFQIKDILNAYGLSLNPTWRDTLFKDYTFSTHVDASRRHLGPTEDQHISISPEGVRWVEDELGENVAAYLEEHGVSHSSQRDEQLPEGMSEITGGRIFTSEGPVPDSFSGREGDLHLELAPASLAVESSLWTGLPKSGTLTSEASERLLTTLKIADRALECSHATNEERAQARAYIVAIQALAEAPEPPADLIWQLIQRANSVAGIASFFVAVIALFSHG
jgi:hypothetical protein